MAVADVPARWDSKEALLDFFTTHPVASVSWPDFGLSREVLASSIAATPISAADGFRAFYRCYAARFDKSRWGDKTPGYVLSMENIAALLPEARFIHLIRDGRDVAASWRKTWFAPSQDLDALAEHWQTWVTAGRSSGTEVRHYLEVRFEALVAEPEQQLRSICNFLELPFRTAMLRYYERAPARLAEHRERRSRDGRLLVSSLRRRAQQALTTSPPTLSRVAAWRRDMSQQERATFEGVAGGLLRELGYDVSSA